eukprot:6176241-Pleurochrysis_carterae.AAC.1
MVKVKLSAEGAAEASPSSFTLSTSKLHATEGEALASGVGLEFTLPTKRYDGLAKEAYRFPLYSPCCDKKVRTVGSHDLVPADLRKMMQVAIPRNNSWWLAYFEVVSLLTAQTRLLASDHYSITFILVQSIVKVLPSGLKVLPSAITTVLVSTVITNTCMLTKPSTCPSIRPASKWRAEDNVGKQQNSYYHRLQ